MLSYYLGLCHTSSPFLSGLITKTLIHLFSPPHVLHAPPISPFIWSPE